LHHPELSWRTWRLMEATDWRFLPYPGGLLDQPDWLMADLLTIGGLSQQVKNMLPTGPIEE